MARSLFRPRMWGGAGTSVLDFLLLCDSEMICGCPLLQLTGRRALAGPKATCMPEGAGCTQVPPATRTQLGAAPANKDPGRSVPRRPGHAALRTCPVSRHKCGDPETASVGQRSEVGEADTGHRHAAGCCLSGTYAGVQQAEGCLGAPYGSRPAGRPGRGAVGRGHPGVPSCGLDGLR